MSFLKPFSPYMKNKKTNDTMSYLGVVEDNEDPEMLGRVRVRIAPYTDFPTSDLPWACPMLGTCGNSSTNGGLNVPEIGSQVRVTFPSQDFTAPYYSGAELNDKNKTTFFEEDYPNTYGYKDSKGNFIKINKARGIAHLQHSSSTNLKVSPNGSVQLTLSNGAYITLDNGNNFELCLPSADSFFAWSCDNALIYTETTEVKQDTELFSSDGTPYSGTNFKVEQTSEGYKIRYKGKDTTRTPLSDVVQPMVSITGTGEGSLDIKAVSSVNIETGSFRVKAGTAEISGDTSMGGITGAFTTFGSLVTVKDGLIVAIE